MLQSESPEDKNEQLPGKITQQLQNEYTTMLNYPLSWGRKRSNNTFLLWGVILSFCPSTHSVTLLQFDWGPSTGLKDVCQQRRRALLERSAHRVEKIKAKRTLGKTQPEAREQSGAKDRRPAVTCKATSEPQQKTNVEQHSGNSGLIQQSRVQLPAPGIWFWLTFIVPRE